MAEYVLSNGAFYELDDELMHYGVRGMRWGVRRYQNDDGTLTDAGKVRDARLREKVSRYSTQASYNASRAKSMAEARINGSQYLSKSNRYLQRAKKAADKMSDKGKTALKSKGYREAVASNKEAGKDYVERTAGERIATFVTTAAVSAGMVLVSASAGLPYTMIYLSSGPDYKLKG